MPMARSAATLSAPIGPAPKTITLSPGATPERVMPCSATDSGSASAAWRGERPSGRRRTTAGPAQDVLGEGTVGAARGHAVAVLALRRLALAGSAGTCHNVVRPHRRRARRRTSSVTSSPTAAIVPLHSCPATAPGVKPQPSRSWWMSDPQMPQECTRTTTWSGPGPRDRSVPRP